MRAIVNHQRTALTAAAAVSVAALLAACAPIQHTGAPARTPTTPGSTATPGSSGSPPPTASPPPTGPSPTSTRISAPELVVSNGTRTVVVGTTAYTFPTTVTDASASPDGSRLAFVDGNGNIATARLDGTGLRVLTTALPGGSRSRPAWRDGQIVFAEKRAGGASTLRAVPDNGTGSLSYDGRRYTPTSAAETDAVLGHGPGVGEPTSAPSTVANDSTMAFQQQSPSGPVVMISDLNMRAPFRFKAVDGTEPALDPDGARLAYVSHGQIYLFTFGGPQSASIQLTYTAVAPSHLSFSPDGTRLSYATKSTVESVSTKVAKGAKSNPVTVVSRTTGVPTYVSTTPDTLIRISGSDAVSTSIAASRATWFQPGSGVGSATPLLNGRPAGGALIVGTSNLAIGLAGAQMVDNGPLLMTSGPALDGRVSDELRRILDPMPGSTHTVTIVGGTDSVPSSVESTVKALGCKVIRVAAPDPVAMALAANGPATQAPVVLAVDASDTPAYVSAISSLGFWSQQVVLLTNGSTLPASVRTYLNAVPSSVPVYGVGTAAQSALRTWSTRWTALGDSSHSPVSAILSTLGGQPDSVVLVPASVPADILAALGTARAYGAPVIAVGPTGVDRATLEWLSASSAGIGTVWVVDSTGLISADTRNAVAAAISGPNGVSTATNPRLP
jgi:hypothetical protein